MKLPLKRSHTLSAPNWHPNFRHSEALPDLKPIRTSFFVNVLCVTIAVGALMHTAHQELIKQNIRAETQLAQSRIEFARAENKQLLEQSRLFEEAAHKFATAQAFSQAQTDASQLLKALAGSLPDNMDFASVSFEGGILVLKGNIRGASENATTHLTAYQDVLRADDYIGTRFPEVELRNLLRDPRTQGMSFEIVLKPKPAGAKKGAV